MQIDRVVTAPGIFAPARTFSVVRDERGIYLIYTARAMSLTQPAGGGVAGAIAGAVLDGIAKKRAAEAQAVEAKLREAGAEAMKDTKNSAFLAHDSIKQVTITDGSARGGWPVVVIQAAKKHKLHFSSHSPEDVRKLFEPYLR